MDIATASFCAAVSIGLLAIRLPIHPLSAEVFFLPFIAPNDSGNVCLQKHSGTSQIHAKHGSDGFIQLHRTILQKRYNHIFVLFALVVGAAILCLFSTDNRSPQPFYE
jgi:hypothetical protein